MQLPVSVLAESTTISGVTPLIPKGGTGCLMQDLQIKWQKHGFPGGPSFAQGHKRAKLELPLETGIKKSCQSQCSLPRTFSSPPAGRGPPRRLWCGCPLVLNFQRTFLFEPLGPQEAAALFSLATRYGSAPTVAVLPLTSIME